MSEADLVKLYSGTVLKLAASIPHLGRLEGADGQSRLRAPLCGSTIDTGVTLREGRITGFAQDVKACALGQASASILGRVVIGRDRADLARARAEVAAMLAGAGPTPEAPFDGYAVLRLAADFPNRHASILLALDAVLAAMDAANASTAAPPAP